MFFHGEMRIVKRTGSSKASQILVHKTKLLVMPRQFHKAKVLPCLYRARWKNSRQKKTTDQFSFIFLHAAVLFPKRRSLKLIRLQLEITL